jgi:putative transposase
MSTETNHTRAFPQVSGISRECTPRAGIPPDNALAEAVNSLYKAELTRPLGPWRSVDDLELATLGWVTWVNAERLHGTLGNIPPAEYEAAYVHATETNQPVGIQ